MTSPQRNRLYYGDNLDVLRRHIADESVDLIYLDPPFKSDQDYNVLFRERDGSRAAAQIKAFGDTWTWDQTAAAAWEEVVESSSDRVAQTMRAFRTLLGESDMLAYLSMMAPRLVELHKKLKPTGTLYLHCDPTASAHLRLLMDAVFGERHFQNEVIWHYRGGGVSKSRWGRRHDVLLFYAKDAGWAFNVDEVREPYSAASQERLKYKARSFRRERVYDAYEPHPLGKHPDDVWDMQPIMPSAKERMSYPTQKPERLLERILLASSNEGDVVLDPFCGCGTTVAVAQRLKRQWIGVDVTHLAIGLIRSRLDNQFGPDISDGYEVIGEPTTVADAETLASEDPFQFQAWALGLVGARPAKVTKGADRGVDGRLLFHDEPTGGTTKEVILQVKAGQRIGVREVRDLRGVVEREGSDFGALISFREPTREMRREAAAAGFYSPPLTGQRFPRIQLRTVAELMSGMGLDLPRYRREVTFREAPRVPSEQAEEPRLIAD